MYHQLTIATTADPDLVITEAWDHGAIGIEQTETAVVATFVSDHQARRAAAALGGGLTVIDPAVGLDGWRPHATPHRAGRFRIRPPWLPAAGEIDLVIDPGHSFGAGSHPSTRLALEMLDRSITTGDRVLDIGSGSGIIGIGAALLGATVHAFDSDPAAAGALATNAANNGVTDRIEFRQGTIDDAVGEWDLAIANLTIDIHEAIAPIFRRQITANRLIVAGVLVGPQEQRCAAAYGRSIVDRMYNGEWAGLVLVPE